MKWGCFTSSSRPTRRTRAARVPDRSGGPPIGIGTHEQSHNHSGEYIHRIVRSEYDHGARLEERDECAECRGSPEPQPADLESAPDRDRCVTGKEEIGRDAVGHEQRRHAGIAPDHPLGRRQRRQSLHRLPECEDDQQTEKRRDRGPEDAPRDQKDSHEIDDERAEHKECVGATGLGGEPAIDARGKLVETVADTRVRQSARR